MKNNQKCFDIAFIILCNMMQNKSNLLCVTIKDKRKRLV